MFLIGCSDDHYECGNGHCIPESFICDQIVDCSDTSDEQNCYPTEPANVCGPEDFLCDGGLY